MKLNACRERLLPHLPVIPKLRVADPKISSPPVADSNRKNPFKPDPKIISRFCFLKRKLSDEELNLLYDARAEWDEFDRAYPLVKEFMKIIRGQGSIGIRLWIVLAFNFSIKELKSFKEAIVSPWSNGQTEGQVNRLKLLKRQMYGRAKFDLLKARLLNPA